MPFTLMPLPFAADALESFLNRENIELHHDQHHAAYVANLNRLADEGKVGVGQSLEEIILSQDGPVFNQAAQIWNHDFYWRSIKVQGGGTPTGPLLSAIERDFGSFPKFIDEFTNTAMAQFGSGWAWLVEERGRLRTVRTGNADLPLKHGQRPLLTIDVWEHAYYPTYRHQRAKYLAAFLAHLANWDFAAANLCAETCPACAG